MSATRPPLHPKPSNTQAVIAAKNMTPIKPKLKLAPPPSTPTKKPTTSTSNNKENTNRMNHPNIDESKYDDDADAESVPAPSEEAVEATMDELAEEEEAADNELEAEAAEADRDADEVDEHTLHLRLQNEESEEEDFTAIKKRICRPDRYRKKRSPFIDDEAIEDNGGDEEDDGDEDGDENGNLKGFVVDSDEATESNVEEDDHDHPPPPPPKKKNNINAGNHGQSLQTKRLKLVKDNRENLEQDDFDQKLDECAVRLGIKTNAPTPKSKSKSKPKPKPSTAATTTAVTATSKSKSTTTKSSSSSSSPHTVSYNKRPHEVLHRGKPLVFTRDPEKKNKLIPKWDVLTVDHYSTIRDINPGANTSVEDIHTIVAFVNEQPTKISNDKVKKVELKFTKTERLKRLNEALECHNLIQGKQGEVLRLYMPWNIYNSRKARFSNKKRPSSATTATSPSASKKSKPTPTPTPSSSAAAVHPFPRICREMLSSVTRDIIQTYPDDLDDIFGDTRRIFTNAQASEDLSSYLEQEFGTEKVQFLFSCLPWFNEQIYEIVNPLLKPEVKPEVKPEPVQQLTEADLETMGEEETTEYEKRIMAEIEETQEEHQRNLEKRRKR